MFRNKPAKREKALGYHFLMFYVSFLMAEGLWRMQLKLLETGEENHFDLKKKKLCCPSDPFFAVAS